MVRFEVLTFQETDVFLQTYKQFCSRRNVVPGEIYYENGCYFVAVITLNLVFMISICSHTFMKLKEFLITVRSLIYFLLSCVDSHRDSDRSLDRQRQTKLTLKPMFASNRERKCIVLLTISFNVNK